MLAYGDSLTAGFYKAAQRFSPYGEALSRELGDVGVWVCGESGLTAVQLSEDVDARLIVEGACRRGQWLGSFLEERGPFDLQRVSTMKRATQVIERFRAENAVQTPRSGSSSPFVCGLATTCPQNRSGAGPSHPDSTASLPLQCLLSPKNEGQNCREESNSKGELASHTLRRNRWSSIRSVEAGGSTVADVPCSTEAHTRFCDDHVLDGGAVSVPRVSLSSSPTAPSVQTEMGYPGIVVE